jgi:cysteine synthase A
MQRVKSEPNGFALANDDYNLVKAYLDKLEAPFYDVELGKHIHPTPVVDITGKLREIIPDSYFLEGKRFYLKEEYKNQLTESVKGRAVASLVLNSIRSGAIYSKSGRRKRWIEPTSGNTGKGLAEIARLMGVEFTPVLSRLDVSEEIKNFLLRLGARIVTIGSEYSLGDLESLAQNLHKKVHYYWSMVAGIDEKNKSLLIEQIRKSRTGSGGDDVLVSGCLKQVEGGMLIDPLLPLAVESSNSPIIERVGRGEFDQLKEALKRKIPELNDPASCVAFVCSHGNSSMALNTLLSQLGFNNVCSLKGGMDEIRSEALGEQQGQSDEFCPVPGASLARSSIEFVKRVVANNPDEFHSFMQYENEENVRAHEYTTGPELREQIPDLDVVVCTFGTGGTATGLATYFGNNGNERVYVAFPEKPLEGIRTIKGADGLRFFKPAIYSKVLQVKNSESDVLLRRLLERQVNVGPSTALALKAALDAAKSSEDEKVFAVIAADGIENYESRYCR